MRRSIFALVLLALAAPAFAQGPARYADVRLALPDGDARALAARLAAAGVHLDHAAQEKVDGALVMRTVLRDDDLAAARAAGVQADVVTADLAASVRQRAGGCPETTYPVTGSMGCFNTFAEIVATLDAIQAAYPELVSPRTSLGLSHEERDIWMVEISDNPGVDEGEPEVLYTANHHAREVQSPIVLLYWMWDLLDRYAAGDPTARGLVDERRLFVVPVLNPDGYVYNETTDPDGGGFWRKNRRPNSGGSVGVDLNRNYGYLWGLDNQGSSPNPSSDTYRGPSAFSEPELQALRDFLEDGRSVRVALNYHTYSDLLLYPWGYADMTYTPDQDRFVAMAAAMTAVNGYTAGTGPDVLYPVNGDSDDWMYGEQTSKPKILSFTPEVGDPSDGFWPDPSRIEPLAAENLRMNDLAALYAGAAPGIAAPRFSDGGSNGYVDPGEGIELTLTLRNDGLETLVGPHRVAFESGDLSAPLVYLTLDQFVEGDLAPGEAVEISVGNVYLEESAALGPIGEWSFEVDSQNAPLVSFPLPDLVVGTPEVLFEDDATTLDAWTVAGSWGLVSGGVSPPTAFSATPGGASPPNVTAVLETAAPIDLSAVTEAFLAFEARWDIEDGYDWGTVEAMVEDGPWEPLAGAYTGLGSGNGVQPSGTPGYDGRQADWVTERIDLTPYAGAGELRLRFHFQTDGSLSGFGWLVDDLRVFHLVDGRLVDAASGPGAEAVSLGAPRPNPTTGAVRLRASLPAGPATAAVFDVLGRRVTTLLDGPVAGDLDLAWDGRDAGGAPAASGVYVVRLEAGGAVRTQRVLVTR